MLSDGKLASCYNSDVKERSFLKTIIMMQLILSLFCLSGCADQNKKALSEIIGVYYPQSITSQNGDAYEIEDEELHIEEDGKGYFLLHDTRYEIRWSLENGVFHFEDSTGDEFSGSFKDRIIDGVYFDQIRYVFCKER